MVTRMDIADFIAEFNAFVKHVISFVFIAIRQFWMLFIFTLLLLAAAVALYWYRSVPYFESDLVCSYNNERISRKNYGEMCQKLNMLARKGSYQELSRQLQIPIGLASKILSLDGKNRSGTPLYEDITPEYQSLYFTVKATDRSVFEPLQPALVAFLSSGPYQKMIGEIEVNKAKQKIRFVNNDLDKIDTVLFSYSAFLRKTELTKDSVGGFSNISALLSYKDHLENHETDLEQAVAMQSASSISVIHGFIPADKPEKNKMLILYGAVLSLIGATCVATLRKLLARRA